MVVCRKFDFDGRAKNLMRGTKRMLRMTTHISNELVVSTYVELVSAFDIRDAANNETVVIKNKRVNALLNRFDGQVHVTNKLLLLEISCTTPCQGKPKAKSDMST